MDKMSSRKPYLIRAIYDWLVDNDLTPYLLVNANFPGIEVPQEHITDGKIVLNVSPKACQGLHLDNDRILFTASFSGNAIQIFLHPKAVLAIYAKENREGLEFPEEDEDDGDGQPPQPPASDPKKGKKHKPVLKLVK